MIEIPLTQGHVALIDEEDYDLVKGYKWRLERHANGKHMYARTDVPYTKLDKSRGLFYLSMHTLIMSTPKGLMVDHKDGYGLNNTRNNLRITNSNGNQQNKRVQSNNTSGFKGVYFRASRNCWGAQIVLKGKKHYIGGFKTSKEAGKAYNIKALELFGEFALLNEIKD